MKEDGGQKTKGEMKEINFSKKIERDAAHMASNLFALHYVVWSSCQVVNSPDLMFPVNISALVIAHGERLSELAERLIRDVQQQSKIQTRDYSARGRHFTMKKQYFFFKKSKSIIDEIDAVLSKHFAFTDEELDFVVNYDIKFRLAYEEDEDD